MDAVGYSVGMAKYDPLARMLRAHGGETARFTFAELDALIDGLPRSAHVHMAWWANETEPRHPQKRAWVEAGFVVESADQSRGLVTFRRR